MVLRSLKCLEPQTKSIDVFLIPILKNNINHLNNEKKTF